MNFSHVLSAALLTFAVGAVASTTAPQLPAGMTAVPLATITNDRDNSISSIQLMLDDQAFVRGIYLETRDGERSGSSATSGEVYWINGIESPDGVVLGHGQGVKAIFLRGKIEPKGNRGSLVIKYLTNGIFRQYDECAVRLKRLAPYDWELVNAYDGHPITLIQVQTWALGISTLANVCPGTTATS